MISIRYFGVWLRRFRKRCGYGVHSPFAFNFIVGVIFERGAYYAYQDLDRTYGSGCLWRFSESFRCLHFLFRLSNYVRPQLCLADEGVRPAEKAYMAAASKHTVWMDLDRLSSVERQKVLVFAKGNGDTLAKLLDRMASVASPDSVLLLKVDSSHQRRRCVEVITRSAHCGVSFDLYHYLVVFFDRKLFKQHYLINFLD